MKIKRSKLFFLFIIFSISISQDIKLIHSDRGYYDVDNDINKQIGNVVIYYDTIKIFADSAYFHKKKNNISFLGHVKIDNGKHQSITSKKADYNKRNGVFKFYHNVKIKDNQSLTTGDTVYYFKPLRLTEIFGNGRILDLKTKNEIRGNHITSFNQRRVNVIGDAEFYQPTDSVEIFSDTLKIDQTRKRSLALSNVRIYQQDVETKSDYALFNNKDSTMILKKDAEVLFDKTVIKGDSTFIEFGNGTIKKMDVIGDAITTSIVDSLSMKKDKFQGKEIYITFKNKKINLMKSIHNAISVFHFEDEGGVNSITADSIYIYFKNNAVDHVTEFGGVEGAFYPTGYTGDIKNDN